MAYLHTCRAPGGRDHHAVRIRSMATMLSTVLVVLLSVSHAYAAPIPRNHPYLFFSDATIDGLRTRVAGATLGTRWARLQLTADRNLTQATYGYGNTREALGICGTCAFAYAITGNTDYADRAITEAEALFEAPAWHTGYTWNGGADLQTAEASLACALVYDWCYDHLTTAQRAAFRTNVLTKSTNIYLQSVEAYDDWWVNNPVTNWSGVCHGGCGVAALAFYDEDPAFARAADTAIAHGATFLDSVVLADGAGHEGVMYHRYGVRFASYITAAGAHVFDNDRGLPQRLSQKLAGYWYMYMRGPDDRYANFNDMNENTFYGLYGMNTTQWEGGPPAALCALFESYTPDGDSLLLWGADMGGGAFYWGGVSPFYLIWRRDSPRAPYTIPDLSGAVLFRGAGHVIAREPDLWMAYSGGWVSDKSHANADLGSFVLVADGDRLVNDPGYGAAETAAHSTVLINGLGQPENSRGAFTHFGSGATFHYFASDLSSCYGASALTRFVRHGVMVNGTYVVLLDDIATSTALTYEARIQTSGSIALDAQAATITGDSRLLHVLAAAPGDAVVAQGTSDIDFVSIAPPDTRTAETLVTVLYPTGMIAQPPATSWDAGGTLQVGSDEIVFSGGPGAWVLASVNGESADDIDNVAVRTVPSHRNDPGTVQPRPLTRTAVSSMRAVSAPGGVLVTMQAASLQRVTVSSLSGRVVHTEPVRGVTDVLYVGGLTPGTYLVQAQSSRGGHFAASVVVGR